MIERDRCHLCGEAAKIFDRAGGWCRMHWDEARAREHADFQRQTAEAGGPWPQTCPRRMNGMGPWEYAEGLDRWEIRKQFHNGLVAKHCSFCGSLHPDDLVRLVTKEGYQATRTDKNYKVYVESPEGEQVTKFYTVHLTDEHRAQFRAFYEPKSGDQGASR